MKKEKQQPEADDEPEKTSHSPFYLGLAAIVILLLFSHAAKSRTKKNDPTEDDYAEPNKKPEDVNPTSNSALDLPPTPPVQQQSKQKRDNSSGFWEWSIKIVGTGAAVGVLIVYAFQLNEMIKTTKVTKTISETSQAQARIMEYEAKESHEQRIVDQRAWISLDHPGAIGYSAQHIGFGADVLNSGKTPAYVTNIHISISGAFPKSANPRPFYAKDIGQNTAIAPNQTQHIMANSSLEIGEERFRSLIAWESELYFSVKIEYGDAFGNIRHTEGCFKFSGPKEAVTATAIIESCGQTRMD